MSLSEKIRLAGELYSGWADTDVIVMQDVREAVLRSQSEDKDWEEDIIAMLEINKFGDTNFHERMRQLCKAHQREKDKIFGPKLV